MDLNRFCLMVLCLHALCVFLIAWWLGKTSRRRPHSEVDMTATPAEPMFQRRISGPSRHGPFQFCKKSCG
jgi:hypothetical protein